MNLVLIWLPASTPNFQHLIEKYVNLYFVIYVKALNIYELLFTESGYAQIVLSAEPGQNLFSYEALMDICEYQNTLESLPNFMRQCMASDSGGCCNMWSLPNYIAWMMKLPSCKQITVSVELIETC